MMERPPQRDATAQPDGYTSPRSAPHPACFVAPTLESAWPTRAVRVDRGASWWRNERNAARMGGIGYLSAGATSRRHETNDAV